MKLIKELLFIFFIFAIIWLGGLVWFKSEIAENNIAPKLKADAIVVLTGGSDRLEEGISLLRNESAEKLFISGVGKGATINDLFRSFNGIRFLRSKIELGHDAKNTKGNAEEVRKWVDKLNYENIILVTSNYHMPRSLLEFEILMPDKKFIPYPVISTNVKLNQWWKFKGSRELIISEYNKYLLASVKTVK